MANDLFTVADFVADALDVDRTETSEVLNASPFVGVLPITDTSDGGITHQYNKYTGAPSVGFRAANAGRDYDHSVDTVVTVTCTILDFSWRVDKAVADAWRDGGPQAMIAREGVRHLTEALFSIEQQCLYGTTSPGDSGGFAGLLESSYLDAVAHPMVINAGGTTASTQTSVYGVRTGFNDCRLVTPMGQGVNLGETIVTEANDANYAVYYTPATMYIGFQMGGQYSNGRICNLHASDSGAQLDDDNISDLIAQFPANMGPDYLVMNRQSRKQLQQSRTATNTTGAPAPFPESAFGVPIVVTDAIISTEAVES